MNKWDTSAFAITYASLSTRVDKIMSVIIGYKLFITKSAYHNQTTDIDSILL